MGNRCYVNLRGMTLFTDSDGITRHGIMRFNLLISEVI